jgi:hypothetical protein
MPFTISHIAAVVPVYRPLSRARLFTAAVIGSMVPDFGMLAPADLARWQTHSLPALLTFCLPVGLAAYGLTLWLIKPALLAVMPNGAYARVRSQEALALAEAGSEPVRVASEPVLAVSGGASVTRRPAEAQTLRDASTSRVLSSLARLRWLVVPLTLLGGALTHLVWDAFTHEGTRGVQMFPQLLDYGPQLAGHSLRLYRLLQYGSSVVGLVVLGLALGLWLHHASVPRVAPRRRLRAAERSGWLAAYLVLPLATFAWFALRPLALHELGSLGGTLDDIAIQCLRATALSLLLVSALIRVRLLA